MSRHAIRRLFVTGLFLAAIVVLRTSTLDAGHWGACMPGEGCGYNYDGFMFCFDGGTCLQPDEGGPMFYCACIGGQCDWWPGNCGP